MNKENKMKELRDLAVWERCPDGDSIRNICSWAHEEIRNLRSQQAIKSMELAIANHVVTKNDIRNFAGLEPLDRADFNEFV